MAKIIKKINYLIITLLVMFSCEKRVDFTEEELNWVKPFKEGDTLVFQNIETLEENVILITKKEVYHPDYDWLQHDKYQPNVARIWYRNKNDLDTVSIELLELWKKTPKDEAIPSIKFNSSIFLKTELEQNLERVKLNNNVSFDVVSVFTKIRNKYYDERRHSKNPQTLYWDKDQGIIKYITYEGEIWERINW